MIKRLFALAALAVSALAVPAMAMPAHASATTHAAQADRDHGRDHGRDHRCTYRRDGDHWVCVTPGTSCPRDAHYRYGYSKPGTTLRKLGYGHHTRTVRVKTAPARYKCTPSYRNHGWTWNRS